MSEEKKPLLPMKPYYIRMFHDYIEANGHIPHILVMAEMKDVVVPTSHVKNGTIVLSLSSAATRNLIISDTEVSFSTRFNGNPMECRVPMEAIRYIMARDDSELGCFFDVEQPATPEAPPTPPEGERKRPALSIVK